MAFAEADDVALRLGRDLSEAESDVADAVIESVTGQIVELVAYTPEWAEDLDPVPATLKSLCVEKTIGAISNPNNLAAISEQLGAYQHSETYPRSLDVGVFLTDEEQRRVRRAVWGLNSRSVGLETAYSGTSELSALDFWPLPSP